MARSGSDAREAVSMVLEGRFWPLGDRQERGAGALGQRLTGLAMISPSIRQELR